jgi:hypothetical protein
MTPLAAIEALCNVHRLQDITTDDGLDHIVTVHVCRGCGEHYPCTSRRILDDVPA